MNIEKKIQPEIVKKIQDIEISTRRLLKGSLVGERTIAQKGFGLEFDQIREYQQGDDVRFIDWKSTARSGKVLVKQYYQEQSRTIWLLVDISLSEKFGSGTTSKHDTIAEIASVLAIVGDAGKDRVGLILFSDEMESYIPPGRGATHIHEIMKQLFTFKPKSGKTNIQKTFKYLMQKKSKDGIVFLISDFIDDGYEKVMPFFIRLCDLIVIRCLDDVERTFPAFGGLCLEDIETGELWELDGHNQKYLANIITKHIDHQNMVFKKYGIDFLDVNPSKPFVGDLVRFFQRRLLY